MERSAVHAPQGALSKQREAARGGLAASERGLGALRPPPGGRTATRRGALPQDYIFLFRGSACGKPRASCRKAIDVGNRNLQLTLEKLQFLYFIGMRNFQVERRNF